MSNDLAGADIEQPSTTAGSFGKPMPFTLDKFPNFFRLLLEHCNSERSWAVPMEDLHETGYDLKAVNPNAKDDQDMRTPEELLDLVEDKGRSYS